MKKPGDFASVLPALALALAVLTVPLAGPAGAMGGAEPATPTGSGDGGGTAGDGANTGGGEGGASPGSAGTGTDTDCPEGFTFNEQSKECEQSSGGLMRALPALGWQGADPAFVEAAVLVHSGAYEAGIAALAALDRPDDPYVLTYLGFASRKLGNVEAALAHYRAALALRPDYTRARSYLGEGLVALGRIGEAREQLDLIRAACGTGCAPYRVLDASIAGYLASHAG
jgi:hypothetical protein